MPLQDYLSAPCVTSDVDGKTKREWYDLDTFDPKVAETKRARLVDALAKGQGPSRQEVAGVGMAIPEPLRPALRAWWEQHGSPASGPVFPARRGKNAGGFKAKRGISYAKRLRTALFRAEVKRHARTRPANAPRG